MAKKTNVENQGPVEAAENISGGTLVLLTSQKACPTYTVSADTGFGMLAMLAIHRLVQDWAGPEGLRREIASVMRDFEMWEEAHRGDAHA